MYAMGFSFKLTVALFSGFVFYVACNDNHRQCFDVESKTICYFAPNVSTTDWDTAWKTCKELNATLPVIHNQKYQSVFEGYLSAHLSGQSWWTAGRYVGSGWSWLNGEEFHEAEKPSCPQKTIPCTHETQAVLTKELKYGARYPINTNSYICSFPGLSCQENEQNKSISWKGGCLNWTTNHKLHLNKARNECLRRGGDLPTFSEDGEFQKFQTLSPFKKYVGDEQYWIGLHRKWWIWNTTDLHDIKFNLLNEYGDEGKDCLFIDKQPSWKRVRCSEKQKTVCQTAVDNDKGKSNISSEYPHFSAPFVIVIVIAVLVVAIAVMVLLILMRKRWRAAETKKSNAGSSITKPKSSVTPSQKTIVQYQDDTYATIDERFIDFNYDIDHNPNTSHTKEESSNKHRFVYSEPADSSPSVTEIPTVLYSEPYGSSALTPLPMN